MKLKMFLLVCVLLGYACKKDEPTIQTTLSTQVVALAPYPFGVGREWVYKTETISVIGTDTITNTYRKSYNHLLDTLINGDTCHKVLVKTKNWATDTLINYAYSYYLQDTTGLKMVAYEGIGGGGFMLFKQANKKVIRLKNPDLMLFGVDSVTVKDSAIQLTKTPVVFNTAWRSHEYIPQSNVERLWTNYEYVNIGLGTFFTHKLQVKFGTSPSNIIYQYYGTYGLMKVSFRNDYLNTGTSTGWMRSTAELVSVNF